MVQLIDSLIALNKEPPATAELRASAAHAAVASERLQQLRIQSERDRLLSQLASMRKQIADADAAAIGMAAPVISWSLDSVLVWLRVNDFSFLHDEFIKNEVSGEWLTYVRTGLVLLSFYSAPHRLMGVR